jgi:type IV pilus assembly protein PilA
MTRIRERLAREEGFTLIELLVVIVIIGILLAIAVPSYLGFKGRAEEKAAMSNVRSAIPAAEAYYSDNNDYDWGVGGIAALEAIDTGVKLTTATGGTASYNLCAEVGSKAAEVDGPGGDVVLVAGGAC